MKTAIKYEPEGPHDPELRMTSVRLGKRQRRNVKLLKREMNFARDADAIRWAIDQAGERGRE